MRTHHLVPQPAIHQFKCVFEVIPTESLSRDDFITLSRKMYDWCDEHFGDRWHARWSQQPRYLSDGSHTHVYAFAQEDDAFAFKMRWG